MLFARAHCVHIFVPQLVEIVAGGLADEQQKVFSFVKKSNPCFFVFVQCVVQHCSCSIQVRTITALAIAALAEAATPYGIESFDDVLKPLWCALRNIKLNKQIRFALNIFVVVCVGRC